MKNYSDITKVFLLLLFASFGFIQNVRAEEVTCKLSELSYHPFSWRPLVTEVLSYEQTIPQKSLIYELTPDNPLIALVWYEGEGFTVNIQDHRLNVHDSLDYYFEARNLKLPIDLDLYVPVTKRRYRFECWR